MAWSWPGAIAGFAVFQYLIGIDLVETTYEVLTGRNYDRVSSQRLTGYGHLLNYTFQLMTVMLGGSFATVSMNGNAAILATVTFICVWSRLFAGSPWLSRLFSAGLQSVFGA
ncbi:hypothetical protein B0A48_08093 [Cryoendolithus antarcticus]|uniref:Uncharacterized protein n=1 Tax=Cryoendolithus antarcticus TaxID=1507870 RepID=A0A1V8T0X7_9PEZI|nr:hypothetical protein B0A48_08093 [Cryoendolithus antarcticus]